MRRGVGRYLLGVGAVTALAAWGDSVPSTLRGLDGFRVERVELQGQRYLAREDVEAFLALPDSASVWDDPAVWEARLRSHPLVRSVRVDRRLPSTLVVRVEERAPVALVASPVLEPVDAEGRSLPLDPVDLGLDLPLIRPPEAVEATAPVRVLAAEAARLGREEPSFAAELSELAWEEDGAATARWSERGIVIRFRPPLSTRQAREAMTVVGDAVARRPDRRVELVDLRWADQVVVRYGKGGKS